MLLVRANLKEGNDDLYVEEQEVKDDVVTQEVEGETSLTQRQPMGEADEGELIPEIVEQMDRDDREFIEGLEDDLDDEGNDPIPAQWKNFDFTNLVVSEAESVPWEFRTDEVCVGATYPTGEALKDAVA